MKFYLVDYFDNSRNSTVCNSLSPIFKIDFTHFLGGFWRKVYTVVGVVVSVLGTLINASSAGTGSNPIIGIQSSIVAVNFYRTLSI
jgi:hypothetical protein